jgi:Tol biopolymer transport system component
MAVERRVQNKAPDIYAVRTDGDTTLVPLSTTAFAERNPVISPDGKWVLYDASTTGTTDVYVRPFPNAAAALYQVSTGGGRNAQWSRDGREIFFTNGNNELARVAVVPGNSFSVADQRVLFSLRGVTNWDVAPDGKRFVMIRDRAGKERNKLIVVENFFEELKARLPR